jgi:hypothetical protein
MKWCLLVVVCVACGGKETASPAAPSSNVVIVPDAAPPDAPKDEVERMTEMMVGFRDNMCKCTDKACAEAVQERMTTWSAKMAEQESQHPSRKATDTELEQMTEIGRGYGECLMKAVGQTP